MVYWLVPMGIMTHDSRYFMNFNVYSIVIDMLFKQYKIVKRSFVLVITTVQFRNCTFPRLSSCVGAFMLLPWGSVKNGSVQKARSNRNWSTTVAIGRINT